MFIRLPNRLAGVAVIASFTWFCVVASDLADLSQALKILAEQRGRAMEKTNYGVAIMLQVTESDWRQVSEKILSLTHPLHVTIAYLEMPDKNLAEKAGQLGRAFLEAKLRAQAYRFCVGACQPLFGSITGLVPTEATFVELKKLNRELELYLGEQGFALNNQTTNDQYNPHITLRRKLLAPEAYEEINRVIGNVHKRCLGLTIVAILVK